MTTTITLARDALAVARERVGAEGVRRSKRPHPPRHPHDPGERSEACEAHDEDEGSVGVRGASALTAPARFRSSGSVTPRSRVWAVPRDTPRR